MYADNILIALGRDASAPEEFAAEELRRHLCEMTGAGPCLRTKERSRGSGTGPTIYLNNRDAAERAGIDAAGLALSPEAFHIETRNGDLHLLGGGRRGLLYAVYDLLETLGCRWFTPEITFIPRKRAIRLPALCRTESPAFEFRDMWNWDCHDPLWWVRNRMNGWYTPVPEYMGGHIDYCGYVHTFDRLLPPDEFFASHPEYFSLVGGTRRRDGAQLCLTNPEVLRIVTQRVLDLMRQNPRATIFSVSQNDCEGYCECAACRAAAEEEGSQSGPILRFVNAVAAETSKLHPDKLIDTLAYWYSLDAPRHVVPRPSVRVRLCSIRCCQGHGYGACDHPESARFLRALEEWGKRTKRMYIWHYATNFAHYSLPMPDFDELNDNLRLYLRHGVHGVFVQGMGENGGGAESMSLRGYVLSRLLWNPQQPVWPAVDEFLKACYGAAAPGVRRYLDIFHSRVREDRALHPSLYDPPTSRLFDDDTRGPAETALAEAESLAAGAQRQRVRLLRSGLRYARLYRACGTFRREGDTFRGDATQDDLSEFDALQRDWKRAGVLRMREGEPLDVSAQKMRNRLAAHPVEWLRDGAQEVAVVPDLGGRLLEWHAKGRQWLAPPDPENIWQLYPMSEGYVEFLIFALYSCMGWAENYSAARRGESLVLAATIAKCLRIARTLSLCGGKLHIESRVTNRSPEPVRFAWGAGLHLSLPGRCDVRFNTASGAANYAWEKIPDGLGSAITLQGSQLLPAGEWRIELSDCAICHRFDTGSVTRAILGKVESKSVLALDLRTESVALEPRRHITVTQDIWFSGV